jgi:hypothetical protein
MQPNAAYQGFAATRQVVHCRPVVPVRDVPEVATVGAQKEVGFWRKQDRVHVLHMKTATFWTLRSGGHEDPLSAHSGARRR